ncbi:uncharacterized protein LOC143152010 [Ptiloglossa arizonensis]|uniref:uncharacterized protein LOC143152010 n=1 Tax=Ptiloglossa arizonensis TaxID=3350558 RepID=UPI003FA1166F
MEDKGNTGNTTVESIESNTSPIKKTMSKGKSSKSQKSSHPPTSEMVNSAIRELKDRKGSSLQAIKKYMSTTYQVDGEKFAPFIKRYLKSAVTSGAVVQTKGKGASGSFKLSVTKGTESKTKLQRTVKVAESKKVKKSVEKKTTSVRKPAATKKSPSSVKKTEVAKKSTTTKRTSPTKAAEKVEKTEKAKSANESKTMSKSKKTAKAPAAKTRTPKPKKVASKTVKTVKK